MPSTLVIAHRGASADAPENTMPAFVLAHEQGAHMLEFDVRSCRDGTVVVFHDDTTARFNGQPQPVAALTLAELQRLDVGGARVPTLAEVLDWACATELRLNIEIKPPGIEQAVVDLIRRYDLAQRVIVSSFDFGVLRALRTIAPEIAIGALMGTQTLAPRVRLREAWPVPLLRRLGARAWHPAWQLPLLARTIRRVRATGLAVHVWTVDDPATMRRLLRLGVDGIITNKPALLWEVIRDEG